MLGQGQSSSAKRGGLAADISSALIFLKKKIMQKIKQSFKILFCLPASAYAHNRNISIQDDKPQAKVVMLKEKIIEKTRPTHDLEKSDIDSALCKSFLCLEIWNNSFLLHRQFPPHPWMTSRSPHRNCQIKNSATMSCTSKFCTSLFLLFWRGIKTKYKISQKKESNGPFFCVSMLQFFGDEIVWWVI